MKLNNKIILGTIVGGGLFVGAVATAGMAYAATNTSSTNLFDRVAQIVGVDSSKLENAFIQARSEEIDQLVKDGKISDAQANAMKQRISEGDFGGKPMGMMERGRGHFGRIDDLATFLGIDKSELMNSLRDGKSLSDIITSKGKTVEDTRTYLYNQVKADLDQRVKDGKMTQAEEDKILAEEKTRIEDFLSGNKPSNEGFFRRGPRMMRE